MKMAAISLLSALTASAFISIFALLPFVSSSSSSPSSYSASTENLTVVTIHDAYPKPMNPKAWAAAVKEVCYEGLDCFRLDGIFKHHGLLPSDPAKINVKMRLSTRKTGPEAADSEELDWRNPQTLADSTFDPAKPTFIFVHGYLGYLDKDWLQELVKVSLAMDDVNTVRIGWSGGAQTVIYPQAVADTRVVAAEIAKLVTEMKNLGADLDAFWLIGHSLGAHTMGFVGTRVPGIGRITGMDPAEPYFEGHHVDSRLDPSDATYVDVIHTDGNSIFAMGFGTKQPMGHVDYYPNGGHDQPGCDIGLTDITSIENAKKYVVCNHERSYKMLIESIRAKAEGRSCHFKAHPCDSYESYLKEECQACGDGCTFIGPDALVTRPKTTATLFKMYLVTLGEAPFCGEKFLDFQVELPSGFNKNRGQIFVKIDLTSFGGKVVEQEVTTSKKENLEPEHNLHRLVVRRDEIDLDRIEEIQVRFQRYSSLIDPGSWWGDNKIKLHGASLAPLDDEKTADESQKRHFCFEGHKDFELTSKRQIEWTTIKRCK